MKFEGQVVVRAPSQKVWDFFMQVDRVVQCIPGFQSVEQLDENKYKVVIKEKLGMFRVSFTTEAKIDEVIEGVSIKASVTGIDKKLSSGFRQTVFAAVSPSTSTETTVDLTTDVQFSGKIAGLGFGILKRKADEALVKFAEALRAELEELEETPSAVAEPALPNRPIMQPPSRRVGEDGGETRWKQRFKRIWRRFKRIWKR